MNRNISFDQLYCTVSILQLRIIHAMNDIYSHEKQLSRYKVRIHAISIIPNSIGGTCEIILYQRNRKHFFELNSSYITYLDVLKIIKKINTCNN